MTKVYKYEKLFGTNSINSITELMFAHAVGRVLHLTDEAISLSGVSYSNIEGLSDEDNIYMASCASEGGTKSYMSSLRRYRPHSRFFDIDELSKPNLFMEDPDTGELIWNPRDGKQALQPNMNLISYKTMDHTIFLLIARYYIDVKLRGERRTLTLDFDSLESRSTGYYTSALFLAMQNEVLGRMLKVNIFGSEVDIGYQMLVHRSRSLGRYRHYTNEEKVATAQAQGIVPGQICVLWSRNITSVRSGDEAGLGSGGRSIADRRLVRFEGFEEQYGKQVAKFLVMGEPYTHEQQVSQLGYLEDDETRKRFRDLITKPLGQRYEYRELYNLAFGDYIHSEHHFVTRLDPRSMVNKIVTVHNGFGEYSITSLDMLEVDAIYWVMKQRQFSFDEELYVSTNYVEGRTPMYDEFSYDAYEPDWYLPGSVEGLTIRKPKPKGLEYGL